jgi:hypothetical protein
MRPEEDGPRPYRKDGAKPPLHTSQGCAGHGRTTEVNSSPGYDRQPWLGALLMRQPMAGLDAFPVAGLFFGRHCPGLHSRQSMTSSTLEVKSLADPVKSNRCAENHRSRIRASDSIWSRCTRSLLLKAITARPEVEKRTGSQSP